MQMEILSLSKTIFKIKGKKASIVVDPDNSLRAKVAVDAIIVFQNQGSFSASKVEEYRIVIQGQGEYEISGLKISGVKIGKHLAYKFNIDGINVAIANTSSIESGRDILSDHDILVLYTDEKVDLGAVATLEPRVVLFYGEKTQEFVGKDDITSTSKFSATKEKLPEKMETVILSV